MAEHDNIDSAAYGEVCSKKSERLLCTQKIVYFTFFGTNAAALHKFHKECHLLRQLRCPKTVQYLAICSDPYITLPILLLGLCDENLTAFLEHTPGPLSYHKQLNIFHEIAQGLAYLHFNGLIHKNLTGNSVLMIAGTRAKITGFKISSMALTLCPYNQTQIASELCSQAFDIYSLGVLVIQILIQQLPDYPCSKKHEEEEMNNDIHSVHNTRVPLPVVSECMSHLKLIPNTHALKPLALQCLSYKEGWHPSAVQVSDWLFELKKSSEYAESVHQLQGSCVIEELKVQIIWGQKTSSNDNVDDKDKQNDVVGIKCQDTPYAKDTGDQNFKQKHGELRLAQEKLRGSKELPQEFQQNQQDNDRTDIELFQSSNDRKVLQLELQGASSTSREHPTTPSPTAMVLASQKDIGIMRWKEGRNAPHAMHRGAAVVHGNTAYFRPGGSKKVYSYQNILGQERWSELPNNPYLNCGLAIIDSFVTSVGGWNSGHTNTLLSFRGQDVWSESFPPMLTSRSHVACVSTEMALVVAGGRTMGGITDTVEVMRISTKHWTIVMPLPRRCSLLSTALCGPILYLAGGDMGSLSASKSVLSCFLPALLDDKEPESGTQAKSLVKNNVWKEISSLPVTQSTLISFGGHILAIGGRDDSDEPTSNIYRYDFNTDSWTVSCRMIKKQTSCLVVALPEGHLTVVEDYTVSTTAIVLEHSIEDDAQCKAGSISKVIIDTQLLPKLDLERRLHHKFSLTAPDSIALTEKTTAPPIPLSLAKHEHQFERSLSFEGLIELPYLAARPSVPIINKGQSPRICSVSEESLNWRKGKDAPDKMQRGAAILHGNTAYFRPAFSFKIHSYQNIIGREQWHQLPDNLNENCGLAVIDGLLTSIGGRYKKSLTFSSASQMIKTGWRFSLPCLHHVAMQLVSLQTRLLLWQEVLENPSPLTLWR